MTDHLPRLQHLKTLPSPTPPSTTTRAWQSTPHASPNTPLLAVASADKSVYIWSLRTFTLLSTISGGHKRSVRTVGWRDNGASTSTSTKPKTVLATGSFDANVGVWEHNDRKGEADVDDREQEEEWAFTSLLTGPDSEIKSLEFSPPHYSTKLLATSSRDKSVWVWEEVEEGEWETVAVLQEHTGDVKCVRWCAGAVLPKGGAPQEKRRVVGSRELLASGSYDDTIRLWRDVEEEGDWTCVAVLEGHDGTVWDVCWEGYLDPNVASASSFDAWEWEPRLLSCSDDLSVRVWHRELSDAEREKRRNARAATGTGIKGEVAQRLPSILRSTGYFETWVEETRLPAVHVRSVYAVDWSRRTGLVVSCGGEGTIAVYREILSTTSAGGDAVMLDSGEDLQKESTASRWEVVALIEAAHNEYEVNHVCWSTRRDAERRTDDEEAIVSTGDDGDVRIWTLPEEVWRW